MKEFVKGDNKYQKHDLVYDRFRYYGVVLEIGKDTIDWDPEKYRECATVFWFEGQSKTNIIFGTQAWSYGIVIARGDK